MHSVSRIAAEALLLDHEPEQGGTGKDRARKAGRRGFNAIFAFVARSLQQLSTFIITILAAGFMLPAEYGIYSLAVVFITLIQTLTFTGYYQFVITSRADDRLVLGTAFWLITGLSVLGSLMLIALAGPIARVYGAPELQPVLIWMAAVQPISSAGAWSSAVLLRRGRMRLHFGIMFLQNMAALIGGVALLWLWQSLYALVAFRYVRVLSGALLYGLFMSDRPGFVYDRALARQATAFSGGLYGTRFLNFLSRYGADLLLGLMFTTAEAGLYRFGNRVATGATDVVAQPMQSFALTQFGAANRKERDFAPLLARFVGTTLIVIGGVAATVAVLVGRVSASFFDPAYTGALLVTYALAIRAILQTGTMLAEPVLAARHKTGVLMRYNLLWTVVTVVSVFAVAPFGLEALAWSQAAVALMATVAAMLLMRRFGVDTRPAWRAFAVATGLIAGYAAVLWAAWDLLSPAIVNPYAAIGAGLFVALLLGLATMALGNRLRVFSLGVFSG